MRYGTETSLTPEEVLQRAREFFGPGGELGLPEIASGQGTATFTTEVGGMSVSASSMNGRTEVTILSREFDSWVERFIRELH